MVFAGRSGARARSESQARGRPRRGPGSRAGREPPAPHGRGLGDPRSHQDPRPRRRARGARRVRPAPHPRSRCLGPGGGARGSAPAHAADGPLPDRRAHPREHPGTAPLGGARTGADRRPRGGHRGGGGLGGRRGTPPIGSGHDASTPGGVRAERRRSPADERHARALAAVAPDPLAADDRRPARRAAPPDLRAPVVHAPGLAGRAGGGRLPAHEIAARGSPRSRAVHGGGGDAPCHADAGERKPTWLRTGTGTARCRRAMAFVYARWGCSISVRETASSTS